MKLADGIDFLTPKPENASKISALPDFVDVQHPTGNLFLSHIVDGQVNLGISTASDHTVGDCEAIGEELSGLMRLEYVI